ncbi:MAG TPA: 6,7-dimethyl-8-ribityllumazine synthase [Chitinophagaceae bacterium]|jgi:6,7-dimethyl-8-ribityllumazine synthase|nr:6,7-dimethyl-8-ribityllumazine synthase [Chitinophagaceae bacterium]
MASIGNSKLLEEIEGIRGIRDALVVVVKTEWNAPIVNELENGCRKILEQFGIRIHTLTVPGAVEIPFAVAQTWANAKQPGAFITLGCVIRGDTPHFEYVCRSVTDGVTQLNLSLPVPVIFGVLTVENEQQAIERTGGKHGHKGEEAAITALRMMLLNKHLKEERW